MHYAAYSYQLSPRFQISGKPQSEFPNRQLSIRADMRWRTLLSTFAELYSARDRTSTFSCGPEHQSIQLRTYSRNKRDVLLHDSLHRATNRAPHISGAVLERPLPPVSSNQAPVPHVPLWLMRRKIQHLPSSRPAPSLSAVP